MEEPDDLQPIDEAEEVDETDEIDEIDEIDEEDETEFATIGAGPPSRRPSARRWTGCARSSPT